MIIEFLADGFEEIEALTPVDILRRAGLDIKTVSIKKETTVTGSHGISVTADIPADKAAGLLKNEKLDMIILPGGMPGAKNLDESELVESFIERAVAEDAYIASICAAPMIPGKRGLLKEKRATCYPGFEEYLTDAEYTAGRVEIDGKMITACGMGAALEFSLALTSILKGAEAASQLKAAVIAL